MLSVRYKIHLCIYVKLVIRAYQQMEFNHNSALFINCLRIVMHGRVYVIKFIHTDICHRWFVRVHLRSLFTALASLNKGL